MDELVAINGLSQLPGVWGKLVVAIRELAALAAGRCTRLRAAAINKRHSYALDRRGHKLAPQRQD
jgi:hypothetical protein